MPETPVDQPIDTSITHDAAAAALLRRVGWHTLPLLMLLYFIAYLDRINIGFAATSMQRDLHFSDSLYGTGAGLFFVGYLVAQVPSNILLARFGARRMIAVLMVVWGTIAGSMAFVHTPVAFLALRLLLGAAEAGFYPGAIFYLTVWLPRRVRTSFTSWFIFAIPLANIFGGPVSTWILQHGGTKRFSDWQVLLLAECVPAILIGMLLPRLMTDTPVEARWLTDEDRTLLAKTHAADEMPEEPALQSETASKASSVLHIARFSAIYFMIQFGLYTQSFWLPKILHSLGVAQRFIGWDVAIVYLIAACSMLLWGRVSDRAPNKRWILGVPLAVTALAFALTAIPVGGELAGLSFVIIAFGFGAAGGLSATPTFWQQTTLGQKMTGAAGTIALINALGNLGGFAGPTLLGHLQELTGSHAAGMLTASSASALGLLLLYAAKSPTKKAIRPS